MKLFLLDTNIVSHFMRGDQPTITERLRETALNDVAISVVTKGEMLFGLAKRKRPRKLEQAINGVLQTIAVLPWTSETAETYGALKAQCTTDGLSLSDLDMMIAAHAISLNAILVTRDKAFDHFGEHLKIESWMQ